MDSNIFKVGDLVKYTSGEYTDSVYNPLWGGKHGKVIGIISQVRPHDNDYSVFWENEMRNTYSFISLDKITREDIMERSGDKDKFRNELISLLEDSETDLLSSNIKAGDIVTVSHNCSGCRVGEIYKLSASLVANRILNSNNRFSSIDKNDKNGGGCSCEDNFIKLTGHKIGNKTIYTMNPILDTIHIYLAKIKKEYNITL